MKAFERGTLLLVLAVLPACGQQLVEFSKPDGATPDTARGDGARLDSTVSDLALPDLALPDAALPDTASSDTPAPDAAPSEAGGNDTGSSDRPIGDGRSIDAGSRDADSPKTDTTGADAPAVDAPVVDAVQSDGSSAEAPTLDLGGIDGPGPGPAVVIDLGLASQVAIAATAGVTNTITSPITHINGNVVLTPNPTCNAITVDNTGGFGLCGGMPPSISGTVITSVYPDTSTAAAIKADLNAAFLSITPLAGPPAVGSLGGGIAIAAPTTLGALTGSPLVPGDNWFRPGVYTSATSILISGDVTLDGEGDPNAVFIFQSASSLTTADGAPSPGAHGRIVLTNGAKASNVWWQVASSATIGAYSEFQGNVLAAFDITMKTGSTVCGRSMAGAWVGGAGAFVLDSNVVSVPGNGCPL